MIEKFNLLASPGCIGFYNSCEVTQLFLHRKSDRKNLHLFMLVSFESSPFSGLNQKYLTDKPINVNADYNICIQRYNIDVATAKANFKELTEVNKWDFDSNKDLVLPMSLKSIPKQFVPAKEGNALNTLLKNNFFSGSHVLEIFDEQKANYDFLLNSIHLNNYNNICSKIKENCGLDFQLMRDRIGNIIFQFPISILEVDSSSLKTWDGVLLQFAWHPSLEEIPECTIELSSKYDGNYMGSVVVDYNKENTQIISNGNLDGIDTIRIWRRDHDILLSIFEGSYIRYFGVNGNMVSHEPRLFMLNGTLSEVEVHSSGFESGKKSDLDYKTVINSRLYKAEKDKLEANLSFKQYGKGNNQFEEAIGNIRTLIARHDKNGVYLWDPFLRSEDILQTLFFSPTINVPLKAIGAINDAVKEVYKKKKMSVADTINEYRSVLLNPDHNNHGLNLEFRCQHSENGWPFHDRFLMFPGSDDTPPKAYSLGTSLNSVGKSHHIIQEVSHPQRIIDAFNDLWEQLNSKDCLVWKSK